MGFSVNPQGPMTIRIGGGSWIDGVLISRPGREDLPIGEAWHPDVLANIVLDADERISFFGAKEYRTDRKIVELTIGTTKNRRYVAAAHGAHEGLKLDQKSWSGNFNKIFFHSSNYLSGIGILYTK